MREDDASFPCPPPAPSHTLFIILEAENLGRSSGLLFHIFSPPTFVGAHTDECLLIGVGRRRGDSPPFRPGEESLDWKCILESWGGKAGTEGHTGSSKLGTPLSHGKGNEMAAPAPPHTDTGALCLLPPEHQGFPEQAFSNRKLTRKHQGITGKCLKASLGFSPSWETITKTQSLLAYHLKDYTLHKKIPVSLLFFSQFPPC